MVALTAEDRDRARAVLRALGAHPRITTEDGTVLDLPAPVADALAEVLEAAADGVSALVLRSPEDLTTKQAAAVLGVSRPTVVRLVESGGIPARMVGTHRRSRSATSSRTGRRRRRAGRGLSTRWLARPKHSPSTTDAGRRGRRRRQPPGADRRSRPGGPPRRQSDGPQVGQLPL